MWKIIQVIILGIVQGITEFLPVSSSAHLILFRDLLGIGSFISKEAALSFDVALHAGTLLAVIIFFFNELLNILVKGFTKPKTEGKTLWYIVVATIPAAILGFLLEDIIDKFVRNKYILIALSLIIVGFILYITDKKMKSTKTIKELNIKDAILIGLLQACALIPGFSRSGSTIIGGRLMGLKREDATKFSFFLSVPVIMGALLLNLIKYHTVIAANASVFIIGLIVSFLVGLFTIKFFMSYIKKKDYKVFLYYRLILGILIILKVIFK